jgi:WD40 repeat protein
LPTDRIDYLKLAFPASGLGLVARWGTQFTPYTVTSWDNPGMPPAWQLTDGRLCLSPDGEWVSVFDKDAGKVRITRVGAQSPTAVLPRDRAADNLWTAVAPGGVAVAWKDGPLALVRAIPTGELVAQIKSGWGVDLRFSPGGRWLTEFGHRVYRVFDRTNNYRAFARIPTPSFMEAEVMDGLMAVIAEYKGTVSVWDLSRKPAIASLPVGGSVSALAISADGKRVLTGNLEGEVTLWDSAGVLQRRFDWGVKKPIAATFSADGLRAAVGGADGQIVIWDLDD